MQNKHLNLLQRILSKDQIDATIVSHSKTINHEHIRINALNDYKDRSMDYYIWIDQHEENKENSSQQTLFLHILIILPYNFIPEQISELSRYLFVINKSLAFPGFGLSEPDRSIYYKYVLTFPDGNISNSFLLDFIGLTWLILDSFNEKIEDVSNGNKSLIETILYKQI